MPSNYVLLNKVTLSATTASVTLSNIPQSGYTDLKIVFSARTSANGDYRMLVYPNGVSTNLTSRNMYGTGSSIAQVAYSDGAIGFSINAGDQTASTFGNGEIYIPNYTSTANPKGFSVDGVTENNAAGAYSAIAAGYWNPATQVSISSLYIAPTNGSFVANSEFALYGIAAQNVTPVIGPYATGGDTVATDGTYWYHAFLSSGTFTPQKSISCSILQVAGGGGAGADGSSGQGAAGGAGGVLAFASQALTTTNYSVTVGAGGAGNRAGNSSLQGGDGTNSQFSSLTASVGGGGGGCAATGNGTPASALGRSGGSGGGGGGYVSTNNTSGGTGTSGQGFAGGNGGSAASGGGGGAGGAGSAGAAGVGGNGGLGVNTVTNWGALSAALTATSTGNNGYLASGGAGWQGGSVSNGGGGDDSGSTATSNAISNTGGGGGAYVGAGGSGIVIIRYPIA